MALQVRSSSYLSIIDTIVTSAHLGLNFLGVSLSLEHNGKNDMHSMAIKGNIPAVATVDTFVIIDKRFLSHFGWTLGRLFFDSLSHLRRKGHQIHINKMKRKIETI